MVTGSREWTDKAAIQTALSRLGADCARCVLIHGGASGADTIAADWAKKLEWDVVAFPAREDIYGPWPACGAKRNSALVAARPDVCLAFPLPGSRGTWDAVRKAKSAGVRVVVYEDAED